MTSGGTDKASILSELTRHFTQLEQAYDRSRRETSTSGSTTGTTGSTTGSGTTGSGTTGSGTTGTATEQGSQSATGDSWMTHYSRLNQVLDKINVPKSSTATGTSGSMSGTGTSGSTSGTGSGTTGSGTTGSTSGSMSQSGSSSLDASTMSKLREFRMHLDNFHTAAMAEAAGRR